MIDYSISSQKKEINFIFKENDIIDYQNIYSFLDISKYILENKTSYFLINNKHEITKLAFSNYLSEKTSSNVYRLKLNQNLKKLKWLDKDNFINSLFHRLLINDPFWLMKNIDNCCQYKNYNKMVGIIGEVLNVEIDKNFDIYFHVKVYDIIPSKIVKLFLNLKTCGLDTILNDNDIDIIDNKFNNNGNFQIKKIYSAYCLD